MSLDAVSRTTFGMATAGFVDVCGMMTLMFALAIFGIDTAGDDSEIAERMVDPDTSLT